MQLTLTVTTKRWGNAMPDRKAIERLYRESGELLKEFFGKWKVRRSRSGKLVEVRRPAKSVKPGEDRRSWSGRGWIAIPEVGGDNNNLHIHALVFGPPVAVSTLRARWSAITGDSFGVDLRLKKAKACVDYIMKYIFKPPASDSYARLASWAIAIKGTRRIRAGGVFYGRIKRHKAEKTECSCIFCRGRLRFFQFAESAFDALPLWDAMKNPSKYSRPPCDIPLWIAPGVDRREIPC